MALFAFWLHYYVTRSAIWQYEYIALACPAPSQGVSVRMLFEIAGPQYAQFFSEFHYNYTYPRTQYNDGSSSLEVFTLTQAFYDVKSFVGCQSISVFTLQDRSVTRTIAKFFDNCTGKCSIYSQLSLPYL